MWVGGCLWGSVDGECGAKYILGTEVAYDIERESYKWGKQCFILD